MEKLQKLNKRPHPISPTRLQRVCLFEKIGVIRKLLIFKKKLTGKHSLALRVHREDISGSFSKEGNPENFLMLLQEISHYNPILARHLTASFSKNTTYLSPLSQNELVEIIEINIIQSDIMNKIVKAKSFSIMADEVTSPNNEVLSICFHFVDENRHFQNF